MEEEIEIGFINLEEIISYPTSDYEKEFVRLLQAREEHPNSKYVDNNAENYIQIQNES